METVYSTQEKSSDIALPMSQQQSLQWFVLSELQKAKSLKEFASKRSRLTFWFKRREVNPAQKYTLHLISQAQRHEETGTCFFMDSSSEVESNPPSYSETPQLKVFVNSNYIEPEECANSIWEED